MARNRARPPWPALALSLLACGQTLATEDAGVDAAVDFSCGSDANVCHSATQYCWYTKVGDLVDAGAQPGWYCQDYPSSCVTDHTCDCILQSGGPCPGIKPTCNQSGTAATLTQICE